MKILMLSFNLHGKGTWLRTFNLANELEKLGNQVTLICSERLNLKTNPFIKCTNGLVEIDFQPTVRGKFMHGWDLGEAAHRRNWLKGRKFDIVHVFEHRPTNQIPALLSQKQGAIMVSDWADWLGKGGSVKERRNPFVKTLLSYPETMLEESGRKKTSGCTVINQTLYQKARKLRLPESKLLWLPNGYFNSQLTSLPIKVARNILGLSENDFLVGYLGTSFYSDSLLMQDTIHLAASSNQKIKFLQIGQNKFTPKDMSNLVNTGFVSTEKLSLYLSACNAFWLPLSNNGANWGRSPYKFGDYLTIGRPIVGTNVGDQADLIREHKLGLITDCSGRGLFEALQSLESDPKICKYFSANAYAFARLRENSWQHKGEKLNEFYYRLLKGL
jgi:glycosyltransferase involved in cell wall biosynthesis